MSNKSTAGKPAYMEECDEHEQPIHASRQAAVKKTQTREKESRSKDKQRRPEAVKRSSTSTAVTTSLPVRRKEPKGVQFDPPRESKSERRASVSGGGSKSPRKTPKTVEKAGTADHKDRSRYYGVKDKEPPVINQPAPPTRPRTRTSQSSYSHGRPLSISSPDQISRPPLTQNRFFPAPYPVITPSPGPFQSPAAASPYAASYVSYGSQADSMYGGPPPSQADSYFSQAVTKDRLAERFASPMARCMSAQGFRPASSQPLFDQQSNYESAADDYALQRRGSIREPSRRKLEEYDRMRPPSRRNSIIRQAPVEIHDDQSDFYGSYDGYYPSQGYQGAELITTRPTYRQSASYAYGSDAVQTLNNRRLSYSYDAPRTSNYESKYEAAAGYQAGVGGQSMPLTIESLSKQQRRVAAASSRSTQSSSSRESEYKKSSTTRTTRSGSDSNDNVTIHIMGEGKLNIAGAEIDLQNGAEIDIIRRTSTRGRDRDVGSERSTQYSIPAIEDRKGRQARTSKRRSYSTSSRISTYPQPRLMYGMDNAF